ncbi:MAG: hypothetical protein LBR36_06490 [Bacteroidales bacterium]|jgi:hypothetical protein|nr:hypothetical protein [Bacteroidales bacterium]
MKGYLEKRIKKVAILVLLVGLILCEACKNDFSVNADYEDFPIIYGLLDAADSIHYVKVFKSFLVPYDANQATKDLHLYSYIDSVETYLEEYDANNQYIRRIDLDTTTAVPKDSGLFSYPLQIVYQTNATIKTDYKYKLCVFNPYTRKIAESTTNMGLTEAARLSKPLGNEVSITDRTFSIEFYTGKRNYGCYAVLYFYYSEQYKDNTVQSMSPVRISLGEYTDPNQTAAQKVAINSDGKYFFEMLAKNIKDDNNVKARRVDSLEIALYSVGADFMYYRLANTPTSSINQQRMEYTNFKAKNIDTEENKFVLGVISSRASSSVKYSNLHYNGSRDSLFNGRFTKHLKFTNVF